VIIAHRLATVRRADEILVVERGRITQRGRYEALLAQDGPFRRLATTLAGPAPLAVAPTTDDPEPAVRDPRSA
jgi:ATP-binding cassette subfamily B protein